MVTYQDLPIAPQKAELFKALGHPVRIQVLEQLVTGEKSVGALAADLHWEVSNLSQQLAVLRQAGVVTTRREGNLVHYSLADPGIGQLLAVAKEFVIARLRDSTQILSKLE